jgi:Na+:H+ antiporter, NhaA family
MQRNSEAQSGLRRFIDHEATGGMLLAIAAVVAILLVNFGLSDEYHHLLEERVQIGIGALTLDKSLHHFINDGLMAIFFFLVGLEIKREMLEGNLAEVSNIILPLAAAIGGIVVPSGIYASINWNDAAAFRGWAIPSATDIAFALGALALVGARAPLSLKVFLLALATFDDLAAIIIIAVFYSSQLSTFALTGAACCVAALILCNRLKVERASVYILIGLIMWMFVLKSGVHATLAGVALGLLIPLKRSDGSSMLHELEEALHPYVKFLILPLFAFANAGLPLDGFSFDNLMQPVPLGILTGLALGKPFGIVLVCWLVVATGLARLPEGSNWRQLIGVGCLAGIGFTMSLFIGSLAFESPDANAQVRVGVIAGSLISIIAGLAILFASPARKATVH